MIRALSTPSPAALEYRFRVEDALQAFHCRTRHNRSRVRQVIQIAKHRRAIYKQVGGSRS